MSTDFRAVKTTVRFHLAPVTMAAMKEIKHNSVHDDAGEKKAILTLVGAFISSATVEINAEFRQ